MSALAVIPFVLMLLCIAVLPLVPATAHHWEHPRTQLAVSLLLGVPVIVWQLFAGHQEAVVHSLHEYVSFICLLGALFVVSGGVHLAGDVEATPRTNTLFLAAGAVLASIIGTTGAAMLVIRALLATNSERRHVTHTVVYAIFIVANCGGLLTPLGDPPLFLGFLRGVPFTWTLRLWPEWLFVNGLLLVSYYALDRRRHAEESPDDLARDHTERSPLRVLGVGQLVILAGVVATAALVPTPWRELVMIGLAVLSLVTSDRRVRHELAQFTWAPILEVAAIFVGIFATMPPALAWLARLAPKLPLNELTFYFFTGGLSAVLDNAPTYATFFELAAQLPGEPRVAGVPEIYLVAISLGAVTCGALTYIGNGPNFMVRSVAEASGRTMPSFGGYVGWALRDLGPVLVAMSLVFLADPWWVRALGVVLAVLIVARAFLGTKTAQR